MHGDDDVVEGAQESGPQDGHAPLVSPYPAGQGDLPRVVDLSNEDVVCGALLTRTPVEHLTTSGPRVPTDHQLQREAHHVIIDSGRGGGGEQREGLPDGGAANRRIEVDELGYAAVERDHPLVNAGLRVSGVVVRGMPGVVERGAKRLIERQVEDGKVGHHLTEPRLTMDGRGDEGGEAEDEQRQRKDGGGHRGLRVVVGRSS